jgi:hypothetical protein
MKFHPIALSTVLTIVALMGTQSVVRADSPVKTVSQLSELQVSQHQATHLQATAIMPKQAPSFEQVSPRLQDSTKSRAHTSLKEFTLTVHKDAEQQPENVPGYANIYGFRSNPSFDGESTPGTFLGYKHINLYGNSN